VGPRVTFIVLVLVVEERATLSRVINMLVGQPLGRNPFFEDEDDDD
jgi:hypothetical protein